MILGDSDLVHAMAEGTLIVSPYSYHQLQPASIDLHLGNEFRVFHPRRLSVDPNLGILPTTDLFDLDHGPFLLKPGQFCLASTLEMISLDATIAARIEGKSSLGRIGLAVHSTAGWIDPGFTGQITLELSNLSPNEIVLTPGMAIGQLAVMRLLSPARRPYGSEGLGSKYQGQQGATPSRAAVAQV